MYDLGQLTLEQMDNPHLQQEIIDESDDPEFMRALFDSFNKKRADSLDPERG